MRLALTLALGLLLLLGLNLPTSVDDLGRLGSWALPIELVAAVGIAAIVPSPWRRWPVRLLGSALAWFVVFRMADWALYHWMGGLSRWCSTCR